MYTVYQRIQKLQTQFRHIVFIKVNLVSTLNTVPNNNTSVKVAFCIYLRCTFANIQMYQMSEHNFESI